MLDNIWPLAGVAALSAATLVLGIWGARRARTTSDFLVARQSVREQRNAAAISGEYLSAASFLGIAGLVLKDGVDALWFPIGFAGGYLALMLFVAAPLRRSGAYALPDFAEARLDSLPLRWLSTVLVVLVGWLYLVPQLQAAGRMITLVGDVPYRTCIAAVGGVLLVTVLSGGIRAVTLVQAFQYWVKLFAITLPAFVLLMVFLVAHPGVQQGLSTPRPAVFDHSTTVRIDADVRLRFTQPVWLTAHNAEENDSPSQPDLGSGDVYVQPGEYSVPSGAALDFPAGSPVPVVSDAKTDNSTWLNPQQSGGSGLLRTYSIMVATFLGTMGLPHVLVRFYTNPSGYQVRRTILFVLALLGTFYLFPTVFGMLSRLYVPQLLVTGRTDMAVLELPQAMLGNWVGGLLAAVSAAGAFAAFLSTSSGLVVSVASVLTSDVFKGKVRSVRAVSVVATVLPALLALQVSDEDISLSVGMAFALAASTFAPMLVLGVWWRGLTAVGAACGMLSGGALVVAARVVTAVWNLPTTGITDLIKQPALVSAPIAFLVTVLVSRATRNRVPASVPQVMLRMHAPDRLGFMDESTVPAVPPVRKGGKHHADDG
jgi:Na+(H+)/acetate symporter ActP